MFGDPFSNKLNEFVKPRVEKILAESKDGPVTLHTGKTVVCMEGRSSTPNQRRMGSKEDNLQDLHSPLGQSLSCTDNGVEISSTCLSFPKPNLPGKQSSSKLCFAFITCTTLTLDSYTLICTSTDFDAWRTGHAPVTVEEVVRTLHTNAGNARAVAAGLLQDVHDVVAEGKVLDEIQGCMRFSCITGQDVSGRGGPCAGVARRGEIVADAIDRSNPKSLGKSCLSYCRISNRL